MICAPAAVFKGLSAVTLAFTRQERLLQLCNAEAGIMGKLGNFHGKQSCKVSDSRLKRPEQRETDGDCNVEKELAESSCSRGIGDVSG